MTIKQIGGTHYNKGSYQHWDLMYDIDACYLIGCATKYLVRYEDKNGIEDLQKCISYLDKKIELKKGNFGYVFHWEEIKNKVNKYFNSSNLTKEQEIIFIEILLGRYRDAKQMIISKLIYSKEKFENPFGFDPEQDVV